MAAVPDAVAAKVVLQVRVVQAAIVADQARVAPDHHDRDKLPPKVDRPRRKDSLNNRVLIAVLAHPAAVMSDRRLCPTSLLNSSRHERNKDAADLIAADQTVVVDQTVVAVDQGPQKVRKLLRALPSPRQSLRLRRLCPKTL